jgi:hypothetical protein
MSKHRGLKEQRKIDRYVALFHWMMDTPAWKTLPPAARAIYVGLARHYNSRNNGRIGYSVRQAAQDANVNKNTAHRMLSLLQERFHCPNDKGRVQLKAKARD